MTEQGRVPSPVEEGEVRRLTDDGTVCTPTPIQDPGDCADHDHEPSERLVPLHDVMRLLYDAKEDSAVARLIRWAWETDPDNPNSGVTAPARPPS